MKASKKWGRGGWSQQHCTRATHAQEGGAWREGGAWGEGWRMDG